MYVGPIFYIYSCMLILKNEFLVWCYVVSSQSYTVMYSVWPCDGLDTNVILRKDIDVNEHERLSKITLGHKL
jgi:hypothetical protein